MSVCARSITGDSRSDQVWSDFIASLQGISDRETDQLGALQLNRQVAQHCPSIIQAPDLQRALALCPQRHELKTPSWWTPLYQDPSCQISLVAVYRGQDMPLHDHTGSFGLSLVLSGRVRIRYARSMSVDPATGMTQIRVAGTHECTAQQASWFGQRLNLHSIEAVTARAQILVVHMPPINREKQAIYFPLEDKPWSSGQRIRSKRVRLQYNMGH